MTSVPSHSGTYEVVWPVVKETYGMTQMAFGLAAHLTNKIDAYDGANREQMILNTCWDWYSGGDTAASVARKIDEALA